MCLKSYSMCFWSCGISGIFHEGEKNYVFKINKCKYQQNELHCMFQVYLKTFGPINMSSSLINNYINKQKSTVKVVAEMGYIFLNKNIY